LRKIKRRKKKNQKKISFAHREIAANLSLSTNKYCCFDRAPSSGTLRTALGGGDLDVDGDSSLRFLSLVVSTSVAVVVVVVEVAEVAGMEEETFAMEMQVAEEMEEELEDDEEVSLDELDGWLVRCFNTCSTA